MPTKNNGFTIERVLQSVSSQTYPKNKIKIVFVDESTDGTFEKLVEWEKENEKVYKEIKIINDYKSGGYISAARNICIANMEGDVIFFWDSDVVAPDQEALSKVISFLNDTVLAAGLPYFTEHPGWYERTIQTESVLNAMGFTAIKRCVFNKIGLFNEQLKVQEDADLFGRMATHGLQTKLDNSTPALHLKRGSKPTLKKELAQYGHHLKHCFTQEATLVEGMLKGGSKAYMLRAVYYFALPILLIFWFVDLFVPVFPFLLLTALIAGYVLLNLAYQVRKSKKNWLTGIATFFYRTPMGVASYYGFVYSKLKQPFKNKE
jgi:glycosyltransferase involved in cell wall biosynthesis